MCSRRTRGPGLALRLTLWYGGVFSLTSALAFGLLLALVVSAIEENTDQGLREDAAELTALWRSLGQEGLESGIREEVRGEGADKVFFRLWDGAGRLLLSSDMSFWPGLDALPEIPDGLANIGDSRLTTLRLPGWEHPARSIHLRMSAERILQIAQSLESDDELVDAAVSGFLAALVAVLASGIPIGWFLARRALAGVEEVTRAAAEIAGGALERRVSVQSRGDELARLAETFNHMLDRIQQLIVGMREMTDNLAHDLRSPLARIRTAVEVAVTGDTSPTQWQLTAGSVIEECDRLLETINTTLDITEAQSGAIRLDLAELDLAQIVDDACELYQAAAEDRRITLKADLAAPCPMRADRQRLQRVIANLLDNALKYTLQGGWVTVALMEESQWVRLSFTDSGVGIAADDLPRIFDRYFRCDDSRGAGGNGLGLSLARAFVRAHGGDIDAASEPGKGSRFVVSLPKVPISSG
jgi:signal transduction histidine kinase